MPDSTQHARKKTRYEPSDEEMDDFAMIIGGNIRRIRKQNDMTMEQVARKIGVSRHAMIRWENGQFFPTPQYILALSKVFKCKPSDFYEGTEGM